METILSLFNPLISIVILVIFAIVAGIYFYMSKTPVELLISNSNERFKHHMSGILSISCLYFATASLLIAFIPVEVDPNKVKPEGIDTVTETSLIKVLFDSFTLGHFFFTIFVSVFILTVIVYVIMHLVKKYVDRNYYYQIHINCTDYKIIKGLPDNQLLLKKVNSGNSDEYQIANFDTIALTDIKRVKK